MRGIIYPPKVFRSKLRYCTASAMSVAEIRSRCSRSAIERATFKMRLYARSVRKHKFVRLSGVTHITAAFGSAPQSIGGRQTLSKSTSLVYSRVKLAVTVDFTSEYFGTENEPYKFF